MVFHTRKLFDHITYEDPHVRIIPVWRKFPELVYKNYALTVPPFKGLCINDSLIVCYSYHKYLNKGDLITAINDIPVKEYLAYNYPDRYIDMGVLAWYYKYNIYPEYKINYVCKGMANSATVEGMRLPDYAVKGGSFCEGRMIPEYSLGYFKIREFVNNRFILKQLKKFADNFKKAGYSNLIIDLRENGGGSGDLFNLFFSVFSDKNSLTYLKDAKVRVSSITKDYGFNETQYGELVQLPAENMFHSFPLDHSIYVPGLNVYILISKNTGSSAASFANVCQYNCIATLVGEPLAHNALNYGDAEVLKFNAKRIGISTVHYDEHTKAIDGILYPDIHIPYIASEYMKGGDPVLEKLLEYLKGKGELSGK